MNDPGRNEKFSKQAKEQFDDSVERLDAATLSRLNQGRHKALEELRDSRYPARWLRWAPAAGVATAAVVAVIEVLFRLPREFLVSAWIIHCQ